MMLSCLKVGTFTLALALALTAAHGDDYPDFSQGILESSRDLPSINQKEMEKIFKKFVKSSGGKMPLLAIGESHHYPTYYHERIAPFMKRFTSHFPSEVRLCSEKISGFLNSDLFSSIKSNLYPKIFVGEMSPFQTNLDQCPVDRSEENNIHSYILYTGFHHQMPLQLLFPNSFYQSTPVNTLWDRSSLAYLNASKGFFIQGIELAYLFSEEINQILRAQYHPSPDNQPVSLDSLYERLSLTDRLEAKLVEQNSRKSASNYDYGYFNLSEILSQKGIQLNLSNIPPHYFVLLLNPSPLKNKITQLFKFILSQPPAWQDQLSLAMQNNKVIYGQTLMGEGTKMKLKSTDHLNEKWECTYHGIKENVSCYAQTLTFTQGETTHLLIHDPETSHTKCYQNGNEVLMDQCFTPETQPMIDPPLT
ncbi:MAG: hypothetical protein QE271_12145 [Bacteriovoracaceae bacterium]|nr:hypothetical protein [Bacteriovoracaceae bacterium]